MADIVMADDGIAFDGDTLDSAPLGGAETAFVSLALSFAQRGHRVRIYNQCGAAMSRDGVEWIPITDGLPGKSDLYIANRSDRLLNLVPGAKRCVFWIHNPATYLLKWRYLWKLWRRHPSIVFSGSYHAKTYPGWAPDGGRAIIPYGISEIFRTLAPDTPQGPPRALFTSNPLRGLDWLLDVWRDRIHPACPGAELHLYSGAATYGAHGAKRAERMRPVLDRARAMEAAGVRLFEPVTKQELGRVLGNSRVLLYQGDPGETFCLAVGEAQAAGLPAVIQDVGCVAERIIDGETGFLARDDAAFAEAAVRLLGDDALWRRQSEAALHRQRGWGWGDAAAAFEELAGL